MIKCGLLVIGLGFAAAASAQPPAPEPPLRSERVIYGDLNVASSTGQAVLRHRIEAAAGRVCDVGGMASMEDFQVTAQCYRRSYEDGIRQLNAVVAASSPGATVAASALIITAK